MIRARFLAATVVVFGFAAGGALLAQTPPAPDLHPILAGRNFTPPLKGEAQVEVQWPPVSKREGESVVTTVLVKNVSSGPIKNLEIDQPWYNKGGAIVASGKGVVSGMLQPNEVAKVTVEVSYHPDVLSNSYLFSHANGTVKPSKVAKLEMPKTDAKADAKKGAATAKK